MSPPWTLLLISVRSRSCCQFLCDPLHDGRANAEQPADPQHPDALGELLPDGLFSRWIDARPARWLPTLGYSGWTALAKKQVAAKGFFLLPRRWVVERTFAWLNRNRRLAKDVEATIESTVTWLFIASVKLMSRRLAVA
jgi:transposase